MQDQILEIHVHPLKPNKFAATQAGEGVQLYHRVKRIGQLSENCHNLFWIENRWSLLSLRALANTCYWIPLCPFPSDRMGVQGAHDVANFRLASPCQWDIGFWEAQRFQPAFDRCRLDVC